MSLCPCGSGAAFDSCCGPILNGAAAQTAEALMRARYTAHVMSHVDFIGKSSTGSALEEFDRKDTERFLKEATWLGLEINGKEGGGEADETGIVELTFRFRHNGKDYEQKERASFRKIDGRWLYENSDEGPKPEPARVEQIGRNDPCACGSGKKYKKCCGA